jgi:hypothetical protein
VLKDSILVLRQENAQLMVEINELKVDLGLREDQVRNVMPYRRFFYTSLESGTTLMSLLSLVMPLRTVFAAVADTCRMVINANRSAP